jgi:hypothetical protein
VFNQVLQFVIKWGPLVLAAITGPIGLAVYAIYKNWDSIKASTIQVFSAIRDWLASVWGDIRTSISTAMESIKSTITNAWENVVQSLTGVGSRISSVFSGVWEGIKSSFIHAIDWVIDKLNSAIGKINSAMNVDIPKWMGGGDIGVTIPTIPTVDGSHANGLAKVPYDNYIARLHKDERVLTADENKRYTPESSPARSSADTTHNFRFEFNLSGDSSGGKVDNQTKEAMKQVVEDAVLSAMRRLGLGGA